jgi:peptidoglycan/xylan/chitin deacetylase (PgdA/CDA1 family)
MISKQLIDIMEHYSLKGVLWSIDSRDWDHFRGKKLVKNILEHLVPGSVILFHDHSTSVENLDILINAVRKMGYSIVPLKVLMKEAGEYPQ